MKQTIKLNQPRPDMACSAHASTHGTSKYELLSVCLLMINISERNELQGERERSPNRGTVALLVVLYTGKYKEERETESERQRETETQTERDTDTDRQRDRERERDPEQFQNKSPCLPVRCLVICACPSD